MISVTSAIVVMAGWRIFRCILTCWHWIVFAIGQLSVTYSITDAPSIPPGTSLVMLARKYAHDFLSRHVEVLTGFLRRYIRNHIIKLHLKVTIYIAVDVRLACLSEVSCFITNFGDNLGNHFGAMLLPFVRSWCVIPCPEIMRPVFVVVNDCFVRFR